MSLSRDAVFPSLKPFEWGSEFTKHDGVVDRVFVEEGKPKDGPFIAYGFDLGENIGYLQKDTLSPEVSVEDVKKQAFVNLGRELADVQWREMDYTEQVPGLKPLVLGEHYYAAEGLLLEDKMQKAHNLLGTETLLACAPVRGMLLVIPYDSVDERAVEVFVSVCYENYHSEQQESISPIVWALHGGKVKGFLDIQSH